MVSSNIISANAASLSVQKNKAILFGDHEGEWKFVEAWTYGTDGKKIDYRWKKELQGKNLSVE